MFLLRLSVDFMVKGQVSVEMVFFVVVLFLLFALVLFTVMGQNMDLQLFESNSSEVSVCNRLSYLISSVYAAGPKQELSYFLEKDANIGVGNLIMVGKVYCTFIGEASSVNLFAGNLSVKDLNGVVVLQNA